ncbi:MAG: phytanoyl-CoA dioxygenase family protein [Planctomycetaceae bacterium]
MPRFQPTDAQIAAFHRDGYLLVPGLLDPEETQLLRDIARADARMQQESYSRADGEGGAVKLHLRNGPGDDDIYAAIVRSERIVRTMERLLGDEVYHYHQKMILKEPRVGGAWTWHQDYGYWYHNGCLFPHLASCMIALDRATRENGCLQVLKGSQHIGRVDHVPIGDQTGADPERVAVARERLELVYCEMEPGAAIFFHSNLLHRSDQNTSDDPRWAFICCYNTRGNDPYKDSRHPRYTPLEVWPDERIREIGRMQWQGMQVAS